MLKTTAQLGIDFSHFSIETQYKTIEKTTSATTKKPAHQQPQPPNLGALGGGVPGSERSEEGGINKPKSTWNQRKYSPLLGPKDFTNISKFSPISA